MNGIELFSHLSKEVAILGLTYAQEKELSSEDL